MTPSGKPCGKIDVQRHLSSVNRSGYNSPEMAKTSSAKNAKARNEWAGTIGQLDYTFASGFNDDSIYRTSATPSFMPFSPIRLRGKIVNAAKPTYPSQQLNPRIRSHLDDENRSPIRSDNCFRLPTLPSPLPPVSVKNLSSHRLVEEVMSNPIRHDSQITGNYDSDKENDYAGFSSNSTISFDFSHDKYTTSSKRFDDDFYGSCQQTGAHDGASQANEIPKEGFNTSGRYLHENLNAEISSENYNLLDFSPERDNILVMDMSYIHHSAAVYDGARMTSRNEHASCVHPNGENVDEDLNCEQAKRLTDRTKPETKQTEAKATRSRKKLKNAASAIESPTQLDILRGRGGMTNRHAGNMRFRDEARKLRAVYRDSATSRQEKFRLSKVKLPRFSNLFVF